MIHSPSFRRLQGKSQLFPEQETDFFRNRLTHSLEVAQIAKSIAIKLNNDLENDGDSYRIEPDIVEFAALAHDLGHPPFGHFGEEVLDEKMIDCGGFEGNAQTLRLLTRLEKRWIIENTTFGIDKDGKDKRVGLDLTCRSIASILKYDCEIYPVFSFFFEPVVSVFLSFRYYETTIVTVPALLLIPPLLYHGIVFKFFHYPFYDLSNPFPGHMKAIPHIFK